MSGTAAATTRRLLGELEGAGVRLGLDAVRRLLEALGAPHRRLPHVLVAGTNGKGSTAALLHSILAAAGYRTGLYTSPHLENVRERVRIDGRAVSSRLLAATLQRVVSVAELEFGERPTYFEALTTVAFEVFAEETDIAVLEVGLGGRLDATNVGDPLLSLITEIGLDHQQFLGPDTRAIAREKAGIMRSGRPVLTAVTTEKETLAAAALEVGARWVDALAGTRVTGGDAATLDIATPEATYRAALELPGAHQRRNLALAVRAAETLRSQGWHRITDQAIVDGVSGCRWPGRLERVALDEGREVLLDAAHNAQGAAALAGHLRRATHGRCLLFGALDDKDVAAILPPLAELADRVVLTAPPSPRALAPERLLDLLGDVPVTLEREPAAALEVALAGAERQVVVCGSIYLVGEVRRLLTRRFGRPTAAVALDLTGGGA